MDRHEREEYEKWLESFELPPHRVRRLGDPSKEIQSAAAPRIRNMKENGDHLLVVVLEPSDGSAWYYQLEEYEARQVRRGAARPRDYVVVTKFCDRGAGLFYSATTVAQMDFVRKYSSDAGYAFKPGRRLSGAPVTVRFTGESLLDAEAALAHVADKSPRLGWDFFSALAVMQRLKQGLNVAASSMDALYETAAKCSQLFEDGELNYAEVYPKNVALMWLANKLALLREDAIEEEDACV